MIFEQPVRFEHVFTINMLEGGPELPDMIYMLSREGITKQALDEYHEQRQILNRNVVAAAVLSEPIIRAIRRELRSISPKMKIDPNDISEILMAEVVKRDIVEGGEIKNAKRKLRRAGKRSDRKTKEAASKSIENQPTTVALPGPPCYEG